MWYLLVLAANSVAILPEKYPTAKDCHEAAEVALLSKMHTCIPAPQIRYNCMTSKANGDGTYSAIPSMCDPAVAGYYCGNNPEKCKIKE